MDAAKLAELSGKTYAPDGGELITIAAAAKRVKVCKQTIHNRISDGRLSCWRRGGRSLFVSRAEVDECFKPTRVGG